MTISEHVERLDRWLDMLKSDLDNGEICLAESILGNIKAECFELSIVLRKIQGVTNE